jgi:N-methylhydantoinase A
VAFGGAGGLHACDLAASLEMRGVLLPVFPGGLSALGILRADVVQEFSRTVLLPAQNPADALRRARTEFGGVRREAENFLESEGFTRKQRRFDDRLDVRYVGQAYHLSVPEGADFVAAFHRAHERAYGHADPQRPTEIVNVRCRATGFSPQFESPKLPRSSAARPSIPAQNVSCFLSGRPTEAALYEREKMHAGQYFSGPAIVAEYSATSIVPAGWSARVDSYGQIHLLRSRKNVRRHGR